MFQRQFECPSCGAPIEQKTPGARTLVCSYCHQTSHINAESLQSVGEKHLLIDYGSVFMIGQSGRYFGREFLVLGRLRIDYEDGFWDEWYIQFLDDGEGAWIQEDDGSFVLFRQEKEINSSLSLDSIEVGNWTNLNDNWEPVFVTSKSTAKVNGGEGELPFRIVPGEPADFVDGLWEGKIVSVELLPDEKVLFVGQPFALEELELN
ncbi:MAG: DUF4178 domain-containing protein [Bacteroidota bacterium]